MKSWKWRIKIVTKKSTNIYVDNQKFLEEMVKYIDEFNATGADPKNRPKISRYLGKCFDDIARNLANKYNFARYPFKEEMISDGIFDCIRYLHKFDPNKTKNPFAYFTQICYYAFIRKIESEKEYLYKKYKVSIHSEIFGLLNDNQGVYDDSTIDDLGSSESTKENMYSFIDDFEKRKEVKKQKREESKKKSLEKKQEESENGTS